MNHFSKTLAFMALVITLSLTSCEKVLEGLSKPKFYVPPVLMLGQEFELSRQTTLEYEWKFSPTDYITIKEGTERTIIVDPNTPDNTEITITANEKGKTTNTEEAKTVVKEWQILPTSTDNKDLGKKLKLNDTVIFKVFILNQEVKQIQANLKANAKNQEYHKINWEYNKTYYKLVEKKDCSIKLVVKETSTIDVLKYNIKGTLCGRKTEEFTPISISK